MTKNIFGITPNSHNNLVHDLDPPVIRHNYMKLLNINLKIFGEFLRENRCLWTNYSTTKLEKKDSFILSNSFYHYIFQSLNIIDQKVKKVSLSLIDIRQNDAFGFENFVFNLKHHFTTVK